MRNLVSLCALFAVILLLTGCISIPTGSGEKITVTKDGVEIEGEDGGKANIDIDTKSGGQTITTDDGSTSKIGAHAEIPEGFPKEILKPVDGNLMMATNLSESSENQQYSVMMLYEMQGDMMEFVEEYRTYLNDNAYEINEIELGPEIQSLQGHRENDNLTYQFMQKGEEGYTLSIMYNVKKK